MTEKKRTLLDEMARIREEQESAVSIPETPANTDDSSPAPAPDTRVPRPQQPIRGMRNATPVEHAKAYADLKKAQLKKQRKSRWFRFFGPRD
ncbi:MAG: hypothetical protein COA73_03045 [Candidatus Hydrogenedentota bacterium]|nr:MAG: hypothetical protein COA73_03045 [Candidatus Hydrogenedentota bacterium]